MDKSHVTQLHIDLNAVKFNLNHFQSLIEKHSNVIAMVKAYAYGHDAVAIAKAIEDQVHYFAVAYADEGIVLRDSGIKKPIMILHPQLENVALMIEHHLEPCIYNFRILGKFITVCSLQEIEQYPVHLKFNSGMNRLGFVEEQLNDVLFQTNHTDVIKVTTLFSHLGASEDPNEKAFTLNQINWFKQISDRYIKGYKHEVKRHMSNTSGIINYPEAHFDLVRLGIGLYGFANHPEETAKLKPVAKLTSVISQIHYLKPGDSLGYNKGFVAQKDTTSATIPIGHADGIDRRLGKEKGYVTINNQKAPILGNVCMDIIMVDVTEITCQEGDQVIVFDNQETVEDIATITDTISYEVITGIGQRIKRVIE